MQLHYYVPNDLCFGTYFQDAFACSECGSSELIILKPHSQQYSGSRADSVFMYWIMIVANMNIWTVVALQ